MVTVVLASSFAAASSVKATKTAAAMIPSKLTILGSTSPNKVIYQFGNTELVVLEPLTHTFVLRNDAKDQLTIEDLRTSCTCTTVSIDKKGPAEGEPPSLPLVIASGHTLGLKVSINPQRLSLGFFHKSVWVFVQGQAAPAATLELTGAILPSVSFEPLSLAFGHLEKGTELTLLLKTILPAEPLGQGTELRLLSTDPDALVSEVPRPQMPTANAPPAQFDAAQMSIRSYRVRLAPHAHVGRLQGRLSLVIVHTDDPPNAAGTLIANVGWRGEVTGRVVATPVVAAFGEVTAGQPVLRQVVLTGSDLGRLSVSATSHFVHASLQNVTGIPSQRPMDIRLDSHAPAGPFDARVLVASPGGEQLVVPVFAIVRRNPSAARKP